MIALAIQSMNSTLIKISSGTMIISNDSGLNIKVRGVSSMGTDSILADEEPQDLKEIHDLQQYPRAVSRDHFRCRQGAPRGLDIFQRRAQPW